MNVIIVCGYGCDRQGYRIQEYLDYISQITNQMRHDYLVITTGGFTNPRQFPGISEASMMTEQLITRGLPTENILLEEQSLTSNQNIENCSNIVKNLLKPELKIYIVCDSIRKFKIFIIANKWLRGLNFSILGFDFHRSWKEKIRQIPATIKDILSAYFPFLDIYYTNLRKRSWGIK